jgi:hypothetical protein
MDPWAALFDLGRRQHGVVARPQALDLGIAATTFDRRVSTHRWHRMHAGVLLLPGADGRQPRTRISAALLAIGSHALATSWTGLYLHGVLDRHPPLVIVVVPWNRGTRRLHTVRTVRSRTLRPEDDDVVDGLAVASAERCFLDAGRTDGRDRLRVLLIDARQRRVAEPSAVAARALLNHRVPGAGRLVAAARDVDAVGTDSVFSDAVHRRLLDTGLVPDSHPVPVATPGGRVLHPDITFAVARVCIECDSLGHHGTQRGLDLDHRKEQGYRQAGWNCVRITWRRFDTDWDGFVKDLRLALVTTT